MNIGSVRDATSWVLTTASMALLRVSPGLRRMFWFSMYNDAAPNLDGTEFQGAHFMNLGYCDLESSPSTEDFDAYSRALYEHVIGDVSLRGKDVLEIGCGRGAGTAHVAQRYAPRSIVGCDFAPQAVRRCSQAYAGTPGLRFEVGDATNLPFPDRSFDVVLNVESSHCYPSRARFLEEVTRVLRPGGYFLYTDIIVSSVDGVDLTKLQRLLSSSGLHEVRACDIAKNVLRTRDILAESAAFNQRAREILEATKRNMGTGFGASSLEKDLRSLMCMPGSLSYVQLKSGRYQYWSWIMRKPDTAS
jgi:ubiquinone/menaquinone biosynthesis C-methylase UbiE